MIACLMSSAWAYQQLEKPYLLSTVIQQSLLFLWRVHFQELALSEALTSVGKATIFSGKNASNAI